LLAALVLGCAAPDYVPRPPELGGLVWSRPGSDATDFELDRSSCQADWMTEVARHDPERRMITPVPADLEPCLRAHGWRSRRPEPEP
jgi:hypothetical protein